MLITITGKHIEVTEALKKHAEEKTSKLPKYYNSINQVEVIIDGNQGGNTRIGLHRAWRRRQALSSAICAGSPRSDAWACVPRGPPF